MKEETAGKHKLLRDLNLDRAHAARFLFKHRHPQATPSFHEDIVRLWQSDHPFVLVECFRGAGKSTLSEEFVLMEALFGNSEYTLLVGESYDKACERLYAVKLECKTNDLIKKLFGNVEGDTWRENEIVLRNGCKIEAVGRDQEQRGYKHGTYRPKRIVIDDGEKRKEIENPKYRKDVWRWVFSEILPSLDPLDGKVRVIGTSLHPDSLVSRLKKDKSWVNLIVPVETEAKAAWPSRFSEKWIADTKTRYSNAGEWISFLREFMCVATDEVNRMLDVTKLVTTQHAPQHLPMLVAYDPARTVKETSDRTGFAAGAWSGTKLYLFETWGKRLMPSDIIKDIFRAQAQYSPMYLGVETNSLEEFILQPLRAEMLSRGTTLPLQNLRAPGHKTAFINGLQPFLDAGEVILVGDHADFKNELESFPAGTDDILNAVAYLLLMRAGKPVYGDFSPEHIVELQPQLSLPLLIATNNSGLLTTAVAFQTDGDRIWILKDWVSYDPPETCIRKTLAQTKATYPRLKVNVCSPDDLSQRWVINPLTTALRKFGQVTIGKSEETSYGVFKDVLQLFTKQQPWLQISPEAHWTLNGFAGGYCHKIAVDGQITQVVENEYAVLIRGLECAFAGIKQHENAADAHWATHRGVRYMTSRPQ